jgi:OmpA-OmpF porin, OOP family
MNNIVRITGLGIWLGFICLHVNSQNLVPNPGFEVYETCPENYTIAYRKTLLPEWYIPTRGTPDYFNSCTKIQVGVPQNFMGRCMPKDGKAYAGIIVLLDPSPKNDKKSQTDYREYLQTKLTAPLIKNKVYGVQFYFAVATYSTFSINRLGAYFSVKKISKRRSTKILHYKPQVSIDTSAIFAENAQWISVSGTFRAKGGEQYMTLGNFCDDLHTTYKPMNLEGLGTILQTRIHSDQIAYFYIDNVSVLPVEE